MTIGIFSAVIAAALLHALWNGLIKLEVSKLTAMLLLTMVQGIIGLVVALNRDLPAKEICFWLLGSGVFHTLYKLFLAYAYDQGDLSRVYPIARGAAPLVVLVIAAIFLNDRMGGPEYAGVVVLGAGILLMARGVFRCNERRRLLPLALGSALATAGYSLVDGMGARVAGDAVTYVAWLFVLDALFFTPTCLALRGRQVLHASRRTWLVCSGAATASYSAYAITVWAMTQAPLALVAALRETSILFAVLIGWTLFGERMDRGKAVAALLIVAGVILTRL